MEEEFEMFQFGLNGLEFSGKDIWYDKDREVAIFIY